MVDQTFRVLEFDKLLRILSSYASCPLGQTDCLSLKPITDQSIIDHEQIMVSEMRLLLEMKGFFAFEGLSDIIPLLRKCRAKGSCLNPEELLSVVRIAEANRISLRTIQSQQELCASLYDLVRGTPQLDELIKTINNTIHLNGTIQDSASHELKNLRRKKRDLRRSLQKRLEEIKGSLDGYSGEEDHLVSIRDGRYVIPVRTDRKSAIQGIIHDYSHTKATCFLEPLEVVENNNRLGELSYLEKEEEYKILTGLTDRVREASEALSLAQGLLTKLDGLLARARYSIEVNGIRPMMNQEGVVDLKGAKNPILMAMSTPDNPTIPLDIVLDKDINVIILSGPNRGGKTVTLKTLGLLSMMAQAGLHIPVAEGGRLPVFKHFFAEIGDDQDIQAGLSTFSAHASYLKYILDHADANSLVIIDEPGMGTDPDEGAALAMALIDDLSQMGALVAVSTHYNRLKSYGLLSEKVKNASMEFDEATNSPTFHLVYGTPGTSYAFEIAQNHGIDEQFIQRAKQYLDEDEVRLNRLIDKLNRLKHDADTEKLEALRARERFHSAREKMLLTLKRLEAEKESTLQKKAAEADELIRESRESFRRIINSFRNREGTQKRFVRQFDEITRKLKDHFQDTSIGNGATPRLKEGQWVRHKRLGQSGRIVSLDWDNSKALILSGNIKLSVGMNDLETLSSGGRPAPAESPGKPFLHPIGPFDREINLIGYRVEDALALIDRVLDKTMVEGELSLRIIHGHGTGRLKSAIRNHLKEFDCVKRIHAADPQAGGDAITIVELT
ncbi:MAG: endonuclease MutS2 [Deltaproteobacteria bacterium]|nr:endonuclease MutS2 [Deltaproteobacteria bacterium]